MCKKTLLFLYCLSFFNFCFAQPVQIDNYSVNNLGQVQLSIEAESDKYYILHAQHNTNFNWATSMTMGIDGTMIISESGGAYPLENYSITAHDIANPDDYDGDGIDDISEFNNMPTDAPFNYADPIAFVDGATSIPDAATFMDLATVNNVGWAPFLDDQLYVKFGILDRDTDQPKVYFINSNTYVIHASFWNGIGASVNGDDGSGEIVFNPNVILPTGVIGTYSFNFSFGNAYDFEDTQRVFELLMANMPFLQNNMNHFIGQSDENNHINNYADEFEGSRIDVVLETDVFAEVNYIPFHEAEGYGFFKHMQDLNETPGSRDIVLYDALPNSLPRVGGIITSVIQTPLSHVNLRAIQDNVPNAYIANPLSNDNISSLLGGYIYYKVENEQYEIREATLTEVNDWYEDLRPSEPQTPIRDLSITQIMPLDNISFEMSSAFGAKCSNLATMRTFGFPEGTIPDGFGIPFYYYDEFMQFNNFYEEAEVMIDNPVFQNDINFRIQRLRDFRSDIKDAQMPQWMMDDLQAMHDAFPEGTSVRCRSSTNNEDLPGFSGAGLYTSKTQHPDEGHISKSIKQIYASMWNFRAYEERDFYRIDHFMAAMGLLCHPNFQEEKSNGVGISIDPIYETEDTFYLNTQVGESLITNPDPNSVPEEILLYEDPTQGGGYLVLRLSNLVDPGELVMDPVYLDLMRNYLGVIHDEFAILYDVVGAEGFGMDIEYKITAQDQLAIKQARPWVSFWSEVNADNDLGVSAIIAPESSSNLGTNELVSVTIANHGLNDISNFGLELVIDDQSVETMTIAQIIQPFGDANFEFSVPHDFSTTGDYNVTVNVFHIDDQYEDNNSLSVVISKLSTLDAALSLGIPRVICNDVIVLDALITNQGETIITNIEIEIVINDLAVAVINSDVNIAAQEEESIAISIDENVQEMNEITLSILGVNSATDENLSNNSASTTTSLDSEYDFVTLVINADNYPEETSWKLIDEGSNEIVSTGALTDETEVYTQDICVNYTSCFTLYVYDSFGDGICCGYGEGSFFLSDNLGNTILTNDGEFDNFVKEAFCLGETECNIVADINISHASSQSSQDASISINISSGVGPFEYSIDGGQTFFSSNTFNNLSTGDYDVFVQNPIDSCSYQETISILACTFTTLDIESTNVTSVVAIDGSITITPPTGSGTYLYSIDGGQNFDTFNEFNNLAVGHYNIVVKDELEICLYEVTVPIEVETLVVINEINHKSIETFNPDDWVELYNTRSTTIDLSNWEIRDNNDSNSFIIQQGTQIEGNSFLVIVKDESDFISVFPNIPHIGELGFGFGRDDAVRLFNSNNKLIDVVDYEVEDSSPSCIHTLNMFDSYGDGWQGNAVDVIIGGETVLSAATFTSGSSATATFDATQGDTIELLWTDGAWSSEVSWEILDGNGTMLVSGDWGDTLIGDGIFANCLPLQDSDDSWPTCADETGNTLELITPDLNNALAENWDCINEFGSPNAVNSPSLNIQDVVTDLIKVYPNPVNNMLFISSNAVFYTIEVYTLLGQQIIKVENTNQIDMSKYQDGVYTLKISTENTTAIKRIIKF